MQETNEDIIEKQKYLVAEIKEKNYDPEKFSDYISKLKDNGTDLNNWNFDELKQVVFNFISQENSNKNNENSIEKEVENVRNSFIISGEGKNKLNNNNRSHSNNNINDNPYDKIFDDNEKDLKNIRNSFSNLTKQNNNKIPGFEDYEIIEISEFIDSNADMIQCIKQKENSLYTYSQSYIKGLIFYSSYYQYKIKCPELKTEVIRKDNDFYFLRDNLSKLYPKIVVSSLLFIFLL